MSFSTRLRSAAGVAALVALVVLGGPAVAAGQERPAGARAADLVKEQVRPRGPWWTLWSRRTPHDRLVVGMATVHVYDFSDGVDNNKAVGLIRDGILGATFTTTHGPRGWAIAFERSWIERRWGPVETMAGFRAGLISGYDGRLFTLAGQFPVMPFAQPMALARLGPVSLDLTYTWVVTSLTAGLTLW